MHFLLPSAHLLGGSLAWWRSFFPTAVHKAFLPAAFVGRTRGSGNLGARGHPHFILWGRGLPSLVVQCPGCPLPKAKATVLFVRGSQRSLEVPLHWEDGVCGATQAEAECGPCDS